MNCFVIIHVLASFSGTYYRHIHPLGGVESRKSAVGCRDVEEIVSLLDQVGHEDSARFLVDVELPRDRGGDERVAYRCVSAGVFVCRVDGCYGHPR